MIDFSNASFIKLSEIKLDYFSKTADMIEAMLIKGERILSAYQGMRDYVIFTDKRVMSINIQGLSGKKKDFSCLPYSKISAYAVETAGHFDLDAELEIWISGLGHVKFEFSKQTKIELICKLISTFIFGDEEAKAEVIKEILPESKPRRQKLDTTPITTPTYEKKPKVTVGANEWLCPNCNRVNQNYVGTCGCGIRKV